MLRFMTAGESHGASLVAILDGMVADLPLVPSDINKDLEKRQSGYGRGARMSVEKDAVSIISGVRLRKTIGSPISLIIPNRSTGFFDKTVSIPRPGHADLAGALKYGQKDIRNILERASARETAARVAVGAICRKFLMEFNIMVNSSVVHIGGESNETRWKALIDATAKEGDTLGGVFEVTAKGCPPGLGSHTQWDRRLDGRLSMAVMSIQAIKGVEIGIGFKQAMLPGSQVHDEIFYKNKRFFRNTNHAGGLEGGMTNGEPVVIRAAMKPISTLKKPLRSVDLKTKKAVNAFVERSDVTAVEAAAGIGEAAVCFELANAMLEKFGGDNLAETKNNLSSYQKHLLMI